jgi:hypothetical protein
MLLHPAVVLGFQHRRAKRGVVLLALQLAAATQRAGQWLLGRAALVVLAEQVVRRLLAVAAERVGILGQVAQAHRAAAHLPETVRAAVAVAENALFPTAAQRAVAVELAYLVRAAVGRRFRLASLAALRVAAAAAAVSLASAPIRPKGENMAAEAHRVGRATKPPLVLVALGLSVSSGPETRVNSHRLTRGMCK